MQIEPMDRHFGSAGIFLQREYYEPLLQFGHKLIEEGDVVIDGGANQGIYTCAFASLVGTTGKVIAFEPLGYAIEKIEKNIRINNFDNVIINQCALSDISGKVEIDLSRGPTSASITRSFGSRFTDLVDCTTIDEAIAKEQMSRLDFIKLDVEGAEEKALRGAINSIMKFKPIICIEATNEPEYQSSRTLLKQFGYLPFFFDINGELTVLEKLPGPLPNVFFIIPKK